MVFMSKKTKTVAITMGDPGGVGPEIIVGAIGEKKLPGIIPVIIGDPQIIEAAVGLFGEKVGKKLEIHLIDKPGEAVADKLNIISEISIYSESGFAGIDTLKSVPSAASGRVAVRCIRRAVDEALKGRVDAVVTAPISKESLKLAGYPWPGHTELLAELTGASEFAMMLVGGPLRVLLVTIHIPLSEVPGLLTSELVLSSIRLAYSAALSLRIKSPRIGVAGLNPHAGEAGLFGDEELKHIAPAIEEAKSDGLPVSGPYPPDVIFRKAYMGELDMVVAMYHDQGLIPLKMIAFDKGVNVTVGLPIVRTSPDHGTAFDIAWKGKADCTSMLEAICMAAFLD